MEPEQRVLKISFSAGETLEVQYWQGTDEVRLLVQDPRKGESISIMCDRIFADGVVAALRLVFNQLRPSPADPETSE